MVQETKTNSKSNEKTTKSSKNLNEQMNLDVPVYTDIRGNIHVNKEYAKEFPQLVQTLVAAEIEKNKNRPKYTTMNYDYLINPKNEDNRIFKNTCESKPTSKRITPEEFSRILNNLFW